MKKILNTILTIILIPLIMLLILSFNIQSIIINTISTEIVEKEITNQINQILTNTYDVENKNILTEISNKEINKKIAKNYINSIINKEKINIDTEIKEIIDNNKKILETNNINLTENEEYEKITINIAEDDKVLNIFNIINSNVFKIMLIAIIIIDLILIAIIKKSSYKWLYNLSISSLISSIIYIFIYPPFITQISKYINEISKYNIKIDNSSILMSSYICLFVSIVLIIIYILIKNLTKK